MPDDREAPRPRLRPTGGAIQSIIDYLKEHPLPTIVSIVNEWGRRLHVRSRRHRTRADHITQAIRAARHFLNHPTAPREPTEQDICDFIAAEEGIACSRSTLTSRWRRLEDYGEEIITIGEVVRLARQ